jgi:RNA polymerase sigma-70 factor, ECF subfamily
VVTDEQLMRDVRAGSREAFEALFERHRGVIWRFFRRRIGDAGRAEELVHDVFVVILQNAGRYQDRSAFRSYLFGIAYRLLLAQRRKHAAAPLVPEPDDLQGRAIDPDAGLWVRRALATLEPAAREVLMLREYDDLSYQEIADLLRIPLNTVRSRLFRARMDMKAALLGGPESHVRVEHGSH